MEEQVNLTQDDVLDLIGGDGFPLEPMFNKVIITLNKEDEDGNLVLSDKVLSEVQFVVSAGETARVKAGQKVLIDIEKMMVKVAPSEHNVYEDNYQIKIDPIFVGDNMYALIEDRIIKCKDNR